MNTNTTNAGEEVEDDGALEGGILIRATQLAELAVDAVRLVRHAGEAHDDGAGDVLVQENDGSDEDGEFLLAVDKVGLVEGGDGGLEDVDAVEVSDLGFFAEAGNQ